MTTLTAKAGPETLDKDKKTNKTFVAITLLLITGLLVLTLASLLIGSADLSPATVFNALLRSEPDSTEFRVLWNLRLPRTLLAILVGIHFALSGLILQTVVRNPLADPGVMGVSSGASLTIVIFLLLTDFLNHSLTTDSQLQLSLNWLPFAALIGGFAIAAIVLALSWKGGLNPVKLTLNGVAIGAIINAIVMWIVVVWGGGRTETTVLWLAGSLYSRDFSHIAIILPWSCLGIIAIFLILHPLSLLRFNETQAKSIGMNVTFWRVLSIGVAVILAASATAVSGPIGFVGLIVPHLARLMVGGSLRQLVWVSLLVGAALTLTADIISRTIISPLELPAGAITTLIGIPVLLYLLQKQSWKTS